MSDRQPLPVQSQSSKLVTEEVIKDLKKRTEEGVRKYGRPLSTFNGRSALRDAYEEALDLAQYLKQRLMEEESARSNIQCNCG